MSTRPLAAVGLAAAALLMTAPAASAGEIQVGPWAVPVPDIAPVVVPVPMGSEAAPLPPLPFPFEWAAPLVPPPGPAPAPAPAAAPAPGAYVANCTEAWNLGVAPIRRGDAYYRPALDRDGDGIACEQRPR